MLGNNMEVDHIGDQKEETQSIKKRCKRKREKIQKIKEGKELKMIKKNAKKSSKICYNNSLNDATPVVVNKSNR